MKTGAAVQNVSLDAGSERDRRGAYPDVSKRLSQIPGKSGFFSAISTAMAIRRDGVDYFVKQRENYGDIYRDWLGSDHVVVVTSPDIIGSILRNEDRAWSTGIAAGKTTEGLSLHIPAGRRGNSFGLDLEHHNSAVELVRHAFSRIALHGYLSTIQKSFNEDIQNWRIHKTIGFKKEVHHILSKLSARLFLGIDDKSESNRVRDTTDAHWKAFTSIIKSPVLNPKRRRAVELKRALRSQILSLIPIRRKRPGTDVLSYLCNLDEQPGELDDEHLIDLLFGVIFPSFDTTALGLSSMFYLLATHPEWQERVRSEVLSLPDDLSLDDLQKMEVTEWAWKETLRLYPVSPVAQRTSLKTQTLADHKIPAATRVTLSIGQLGFLPEYWEHPKRFDPERFSPQRAEDRGHEYIYMPLGHDLDRCTSAQLSSMEMKLLCIAILKRYRIELQHPYDARHRLAPLGSVSGDIELKLNKL